MWVSPWHSGPPFIDSRKYRKWKSRSAKIQEHYKGPLKSNTCSGSNFSCFASGQVSTLVFFGLSNWQKIRASGWVGYQYSCFGLFGGLMALWQTWCFINLMPNFVWWIRFIEPLCHGPWMDRAWPKCILMPCNQLTVYENLSGFTVSCSVIFFSFAF